MKVLIAVALMIVSVSAFSAGMGAVDSLTSVLPVGSYQGKDDAGNSCRVVVNDVNFPAKTLTVTVSNDKLTIFKIINDGSEFLFRAYKKEFIQTERQYIDVSNNSFIDRIIRTTMVGDNTLYVVVSNELTENTQRTVKSVECVVNL
jgi:hypothetical protein